MENSRSIHKLPIIPRWRVKRSIRLTILPPGFEDPVGFQMLDITASQHLYGVNENGYTPGYQNTSATLAGSDLTYSITNSSADETIWVGSKVASVKCLDFSAWTSPVAINLDAGTFSSNFVGPAIYSGYAAGANDSIAIALNTVINVGVSDNQASTLIADSTPGDNDVSLEAPEMTALRLVPAKTSSLVAAESTPLFFMIRWLTTALSAWAPVSWSLPIMRPCQPMARLYLMEASQACNSLTTR